MTNPGDRFDALLKQMVQGEAPSARKKQAADQASGETPDACSSDTLKLHSTLRVTPAMAAGVTDRLWEIGDIVALVEAAEPASKPRGPYKKRKS